MGIAAPNLNPFPNVPRSFTREDYQRLLDQQGGACAICERECELVVDHCHQTGVVRGLLCGACNSGLGMLGDDLPSLEAALAYLKAVVTK